MLNKIKFAFAMSAVAAAMGSTAAYADTETATATATILQAVEVTVDNGIDFGTIAASAAGGTVTLPNASNTRTCTGVVCIGTASRAAFHVSNANDGSVIAISVGNPQALTGPGAPMTLSALSMSDADGLITFDSAALETVYVGGQLSIGANQTAGVYNGSFDVTAEYQ
ncbi:DUF4402 domain-containing protein [Sphingorhabdus sp.]|jgi:hypothetical protein|uniref:DUF4402 domain-containing protein n=1 Tax=Sphingorhabdus sp. TaxID=1902408 RepID=UPI003BB112DC|nr:DUF4402 domain-containing protein [Sphingomonadales bacterium]MBK9432137.1 DUF4402 domain-containing protein [Sphingomonadales bacterium]MBL0023339.1 DUF4402 domain-containing protein [Sphingomonadales bacterium]